MYTFQERTRAKEFYVRYARRRAPHHASWDIRVASNLWHGIRNERQAKAAWQKRSAVKHYLSHGRYNPSPTVSLATQDVRKSLSAGSTSSRLWSARRQWQDRSASGRGSRSGRIGPVPYCTGGGGSWHAEEASPCIQEPADLFACQIVNLASLLYALGNVRCSLHLAKPLRDPVCRLGAECLYGREPAVYGLRRIVAPLGQEQQEFLDVLCRELAHAHLRCIGAPLVAQPSEHKREHIAIRRDALR